MRSLKVLYTLPLALLLVGAGCAAYPQATVKVQTPEATIDAAANGILNASSEESKLQQGEEQTAGKVDDDSAEINAYSQTDYEVR